MTAKQNALFTDLHKLHYLSSLLISVLPCALQNALSLVSEIVEESDFSDKLYNSAYVRLID